MNPFKLRQDKEKAERWKRFLNEDGFADTLRTIEKELIGEWRKSLTQRGRDRAWHDLRALERVQTKINTVMSAGKYADNKLKD